MIYLAGFVVLVLATARLTRAVSRDDITSSWRLHIDRKFGETSWISRLIWCHWCSGWWISALTSMFSLTTLIAFGAARPLHLLAWPVLFPAVAYAASWIIDKEDD